MSRQSPCLISPRRSPRLSANAAKSDKPWRSIAGFLKPASPATKARRKRQERAQEKARREKAAAAAAAAARAKPPSPPPSKRAPKSKADRKKARGRSSPPAKQAAKKQKSSVKHSAPGRRKYAQVDQDNLAKAIAFYFAQQEKGERWQKTKVARKFGLETRTFANYVHDDPKKRMHVGCKPGRPSIVSKEDHEFIVETTVTGDRGNEGLRPKEVIRNLIDLSSANGTPLKEQQAMNYVYKTLRKDKRVTNKS